MPAELPTYSAARFHLLLPTATLSPAKAKAMRAPQPEPVRPSILPLPLGPLITNLHIYPLFMGCKIAPRHGFLVHPVGFPVAPSPLSLEQPQKTVLYLLRALARLARRCLRNP